MLLGFGGSVKREGGGEEVSTPDRLVRTREPMTWPRHIPQLSPCNQPQHGKLHTRSHNWTLEIKKENPAEDQCDWHYEKIYSDNTGCMCPAVMNYKSIQHLYSNKEICTIFVAIRMKSLQFLTLTVFCGHVMRCIKSY